jgi:hypothetical protein
VHVYVLYHPQTKRIHYTGISEDPAARFIQHGGDSTGLKMKRITSEKVLEREGRSIESAVMTKYPRTQSLSIHKQFQSHPIKKNRRLSIGKHHKFAASLISKGGTWLTNNADWALREFLP